MIFEVYLWMNKYNSRLLIYIFTATRTYCSDAAIRERERKKKQAKEIIRNKDIGFYFKFTNKRIERERERGEWICEAAACES